MGNGSVSVKVTRDEFEKKSTDEKLVCLWDVVSVLQSDMAAAKKWMFPKSAAVVCGSGLGGAGMMLFIHMFKIRPF